MKLLKNITDFFFSLKTTLWSLFLLVAMFLAGAFIMPVREEFQTIHSAPFFQWLAGQPLSVTWWLWCSLGILLILTVNTLFCSIESIVKKRKGTNLLLLVSPQVIHIGFLFILFAHLLSATGGLSAVVAANEGTMFGISADNDFLRIRDINIFASPDGYISDWEVNIEYLSDKGVVLTDKIKPNQPSLQMGLNVNVKDITAQPYKAVLLQISKDPGASWALAGGILFTIGIVTLIIFRMKTERISKRSTALLHKP